MKKYNVPNYIRYKNDVIACQPDEDIALENTKSKQFAIEVFTSCRKHRP